MGSQDDSDWAERKMGNAGRGAMKCGRHPGIRGKTLSVGAYGLSHIQSFFSSDSCDLQSSIMFLFAGVCGC